MHTKKAMLVKIILSRGLVLRFLKKLIENRNMKKKYKVFILSELLLPPFGANKLIFLYFLTYKAACCYCKN